MTPQFKEFPKMPRLSREIIITEKIDGTNACICITEEGEFFTGSRTRWITPSDDNHNFSKWAHENKESLMGLGVGTHFGEWWGSGIGRGYGLLNGEKRFSLFNVSRWGDSSVRPDCCDVVPELWRGNFDELFVTQHGRAIDFILYTLTNLRNKGSKAAPGFMRPEGIIIYHTAGNFGFKKTIEKDEIPKSLQV